MHSGQFGETNYFVHSCAELFYGITVHVYTTALAAIYQAKNFSTMY